MTTTQTVVVAGLIAVLPAALTALFIPSKWAVLVPLAPLGIVLVVVLPLIVPLYWWGLFLGALAVAAGVDYWTGRRAERRARKRSPGPAPAA
jgi:hypothetical protein